MRGSRFKTIGLAGFAATLNLCFAATFGTVVPVRGTVSDIALDESRGRLYAANFSAYRVEVINTTTRALLSPLLVPLPPSSVAVSPDNHYLVIGQYQKPDPDADPAVPTALGGGYTIIDLQTNQRWDVSLNNPVVAVAFGSDGRAVMLTRQPKEVGDNGGGVTNLFVLDPASQFLQGVRVVGVKSLELAVPIATFPAQIIQASSGVSGDRNKIAFLAATEEDKTGTSNKSVVIRYTVGASDALVENWQSDPPLGPRSVSLDTTGDFILRGWGLHHYVGEFGYLWAQLPDASPGAFHIGSHAWDYQRNVIYLQSTGPDTTPVLHVMDTDNLTVRERIQLREDLSGKSVMSNDSNIMYSASESGVTILPVGQLSQTPRVGSVQEDLFFTADACVNLGAQRTLNIVSLGSAPADFKLSLPSGVSGITLSRTSGTTPAQVVVTIDPAAFQDNTGTTSVMLTIDSTNAVNLPPAVRLLVNTRDFNQRGQILNVPGKLVDMLADPIRNRLYVLRQDKNQVLVYAIENPLRLIATLRTGNTPTGMAITADNLYLIVGNNNSQIANVYDLEGVRQVDPIIAPPGHYPRAIGVASNGIFMLSRLASDLPKCTPENTGPASMDVVDFGNRIAYTPCTLSAGAELSIYQNGLPSFDGAFAATPDHHVLLLGLADGNVLEYDAAASVWVASRKDFSSLEGAFGAFHGNLFLAGNTLLDAALVPVGQALGDGESTSSGVAQMDGAGLWTTTAGSIKPGVIHRVDLANLNAYNATPIAESPVTKDALLGPQVGQIGQSIPSITRSLAVWGNQIFALTISGLTILPQNFDAALAKPVITSVVNSADGTTAIAVGGDINIKGVNLAPAPVSAGKPPLSTSLGNVCAVLGDTPIALFSVSSPLLVAQLPYSLTGASSLVVHTPGGISDPFPVNVQTQAPAIFSAIRNDNGEPLNFTNPIHPSNEITIYLTGLGVTSPLPALGDVPPSGQVANVIGPVTVTLGSAQMFVTSVTLTPDQVGVYQIKATAPGWVSAGRNVPLTVRAGSVTATYSVRVVTP